MPGRIRSQGCKLAAISGFTTTYLMLHGYRLLSVLCFYSINRLNRCLQSSWSYSSSLLGLSLPENHLKRVRSDSNVTEWDPVIKATFKLEGLRGGTRLDLRENRQSHSIRLSHRSIVCFLKIRWHENYPLSKLFIFPWHQEMWRLAEPKERLSECGRPKTTSDCKSQSCSVTRKIWTLLSSVGTNEG